MRESMIFTGLEVLDLLTKTAHDKLGREGAWTYNDRLLSISALSPSKEADEWTYNISWGDSKPIEPKADEQEP